MYNTKSNITVKRDSELSHIHYVHTYDIIKNKTLKS
jgi:hypothetical protein